MLKVEPLNSTPVYNTSVINKLLEFLTTISHRFKDTGCQFKLTLLFAI